MAVAGAFDRQRMLALEAHPLLDPARDRAHLHVGAAGRDQEVVRDRTQMLDLEHDQVVGLFFERRLRGGYGLLLANSREARRRTEPPGGGRHGTKNRSVE